MNALRNKVQLIGNLGMDPEVTNFETGNSLVKFSLATSEFYKDKEGNLNKNTQWHNLVAWNGMAKNIGKLLRKGSEVAVEGRLNHRQYIDKDGNKKYITEIVVNDFVMLGKKKEEKN